MKPEILKIPLNLNPERKPELEARANAIPSLETEDELKRWAHQFIHLSKANLLGDGEVHQMMFLVGEKTFIPVLAEMPMRQIAPLIREEAKKLDIHTVIMVAEAWVASAKSKEDMLSGPPPSGRPDRKESLIVTVAGPSRRLMAFWCFDRDADGKPVMQGDGPEYMETFEGWATEGFWDNLQ